MFGLGRAKAGIRVGLLCCTLVAWSGARADERAGRVEGSRVVLLSPVKSVAGETHGVGIGKSCDSPQCIGDKLSCQIEISHNDGFGDTIEILEAWDVVDPDGQNVRVPDAGNLPISQVSGNTTCTVGGSLPCLICAGGLACGKGLPSKEPGVVTFTQDQYTIDADDPKLLEDQANVRVKDVCDRAPQGACSEIINRVQFTAATEIVPCCGNNLAEGERKACCKEGDPNTCTSGCTTNADCTASFPICTITHLAEACDGTDAATCNSACRAPGGENACTCCGDAVVQTGEFCDDGNTVNTDSCRNDCTRCGDGVVNGGEQCDDGNTNNLDGCRNDCILPICGDNIQDSSETCDGTAAETCNLPCRASTAPNACTCCGDALVQTGEFCDDGNTVNTDACRNDCTRCGDGVVNGGEQCDDGNTNNLDGCRNDCILPICGDNIQDSSETCDGTAAETCNLPCRASTAPNACTCCGDALVQTGEFCDDGNTVNTDSCRNDCTRCGDGVVNGGEQCDDGNTVNTDGCRNNCTLPVCGDSITDPKETCDGQSAETCTQACRAAGGADECTCCGDGVLQTGENCDDGNATNGDGCNTTCIFVCGDGDVNLAGETCDGGDASACNNVCRSATAPNPCTCCGDGIVQTGEQCDDGNKINGDGCSTQCLPEARCGDNLVNQDSETCDGTDDEGCHRACRTPGKEFECTCCGDGIINGDEQCDDGNAVNDDGCNNKCFFACGDGAVNRDEETCDGEDAEVCNGPCREAGADNECTCCGDGILQEGEDCDDGNMVNGDGCNTTCVYDCGDNDVNTPAETCDGTDSEQCHRACRTPGSEGECTCCGDGVVQLDEDCDDGNKVNGDGCNFNCTYVCGDGDINVPGETCDGADASVCNSACRPADGPDRCTCCGDGLVQTGEECDDGNKVNGDGCDTTCLIEVRCGDNVVNQDSETCDGSDDEGCHRDCRAAGGPAECTCCGDGILQLDEDCDDGNDVNNDGCDNKCFFKCGDGAVNRDEESCDGADDEVCNLPCRAAGSAHECTCCGDGVVQEGEQCDDGNKDDQDGCDRLCQVEGVCGDNLVNQDSETCDGTDDEGCHRSCRRAGLMDECTCCGDGIVNGDEDCDDGNSNTTDGCDNKCFFKCGDGDVNLPEETCDGYDDDVCNKPCRAAGGAHQCTCCGDGIKQGDEACDDGNKANGDGCNTKCQLENRCGNNHVDGASETCDGYDDDTCNKPCRAPGGTHQCTCCGDGIKQGSEQCDDGNTNNNDGCNSKCELVTRCGDNLINRTGETCDGTSAQVCNSSCRAPGSSNQCTCCGDGIKQGGEECDDGNKYNGDGCSTTCRRESVCGDGIVNPPTETCDGDDGHDDDDDGDNDDCDDDDDHSAAPGDVVATGDDNDDCDDDDDDHSATGGVVATGDHDDDEGDHDDDDEGDHDDDEGDHDDDEGDHDDDDDGDHHGGCVEACRAPGTVDQCTCCGDGMINGDEECDGDDWGDCAHGCNRDCTCDEAGGEGCTPGYWKNPEHIYDWEYSPYDRVNTIFGVSATNNPKLIVALATGGGGEIAMLRHAVAALLSSAHDDVDYLYTTAQVIQMVKTAYATGDFATAHALFAAQNEMGCPLGKSDHGAREDDEAARGALQLEKADDR